MLNELKIGDTIPTVVGNCTILAMPTIQGAPWVFKRISDGAQVNLVTNSPIVPTPNQSNPAAEQQVAQFVAKFGKPVQWK